MAEKETKNEPKDVIEPIPEEVKELEKKEKEQIKKEEKKEALAPWEPKTQIGRFVKEGKETNIDNLLDHGKKILEPEIVDFLLDLDTDLILVGQAKGKFGGGKRRAWRQTQKKTQEGNILSFSCMAIVGDKKGHIGVGYGKAKETLPAREKAIRKAKLNIIKIERGFETKEKNAEPHTIPFKLSGKCGSVKLTLLPAPRGTGLVIGDEGKKILRLAGIKDIYSVTKGKTKTTFNLAKACINALSKTVKMKK